MDDSISRKAAIDEINKYILSFDAIDANFLDGLRTSIKLIKENLPSEQQWILCSERPSNNQEEVIVSIHDDSGDTSFDYTTCGWITPDNKYWIVDNDINYHVVAWMPRPKPLGVEEK